MRPLQLATAGDRLSVLCLGAHSDDIEIGVGATLLSMIARGVRLDVQWCVLSGVGERETRGQGFGRGVSFRGGERTGRSDDVSGWLLPGTGRCDQVVVRDAEDARRSRRHSHAPPRRRAPGPSPALPLDVEYFPGPLHPRIRDPEVGWRSWAAPTLRADFRQRASAQDRPSDDAFRKSALQPLVRFGNLSRLGPAERYGMSCAGKLRGSVLCAQAQPDLTVAEYLSFWRLEWTI